MFRPPLFNYKTRAQAAFRFCYLDLDTTADDNECAAVADADADPWSPCFCPACNCKTGNHQWPALQVLS